MNIKECLKQLMLWLGIEKNHTSHSEKIISAIGAMIGIFVTILSTKWLLHNEFITIQSSFFIVASFGATAVLVFAVPHGALAQPWQVFGGHLFSAFVGVSCQYFLGNSPEVAALAVGLSVGLMYYARCIHPPGGATALTAVIAGDNITQLGYMYLLSPVLLNVIVILITAMAFNALFPWRRYPIHFSRINTAVPQVESDIEDIALTTEDFNAAIRELDSFVDLTEEGLSELLEKARQNALLQIEHPDKIEAGHFYSNGKIGHLWAVRQIIDDGEQNNRNDLIIYKTVAGLGLYDIAVLHREEFRQWARFEVFERHGRWLKAD